MVEMKRVDRYILIRWRSGVHEEEGFNFSTGDKLASGKCLRSAGAKSHVNYIHERGLWDPLRLMLTESKQDLSLSSCSSHIYINKFPFLIIYPAQKSVHLKF